MSEIDDTPGSRLPAAGDTAAAGIPSEHLLDTTQARIIGRKRLRLDMAFRLFCSVVSGHSVAAQSDFGTTRAWCWKMADHFLADHDRPTPPLPNTTAAEPVPDVVHQRWYLTWLRDRDGSCLTSEAPPGMDPAAAATTRRHLHKRGLIAATHQGGAVEATGWALTAAGWNTVGVPEPTAVEGVLPAERAA